MGNTIIVCYLIKERDLQNRTMQDTVPAAHLSARKVKVATKKGGIAPNQRLGLAPRSVSRQQLRVLVPASNRALDESSGRRGTLCPRSGLRKEWSRSRPRPLVGPRPI